MEIPGQALFYINFEFTRLTYPPKKLAPLATRHFSRPSLALLHLHVIDELLNLLLILLFANE
jgi:hypothetical protein